MIPYIEKKNVRLKKKSRKTFTDKMKLQNTNN